MPTTATTTSTLAAIRRACGDSRPGVAVQLAAGLVLHRGGVADRAGDPFQDRGQRCVDPVVVAEQHVHVGRERSGDQQPGIALQRQDAVVLQKGDRAGRGAAAERRVRVEVDRAGGGGRVAQHAQAIAECQHAGERSIDVGLVDQVPIQRVGERSVGAADLQVAAGAQRGRRRLGFIRHVAVSLVGIRDGECIAHHQPLETPGAAERVLQQLAAGAARYAVDGVVRRHDRGDPRLDAGLEGGQVGLLQVLRRDRHVEAVPERLGAAVHGEVLGAGGDAGGCGIRPLQRRGWWLAPWRWSETDPRQRSRARGPSAGRGRC